MVGIGRVRRVMSAAGRSGAHAVSRAAEAIRRAPGMSQRRRPLLLKAGADAWRRAGRHHIRRRGRRRRVIRRQNREQVVQVAQQIGAGQAVGEIGQKPLRDTGDV